MEQAIEQAKLIISKKGLCENDCLETVNYMDAIIKHNILCLLPERVRYDVYIKAVESAKKLMDIDKVLFYFDSLVSTLSAEEKATSPLYKEILINIFSMTIYSEHHNYEKQIEMIGEVYSLSAPECVNTFKIDVDRKKINIGFLSSDFMFHPVGRFVFSLFKDETDNKEIDYFCYYSNSKNRFDFVTGSIKRGSHKFTEIHQMSDEETEETILKDKLDIMIDLNGLSANNRMRLVSKRLAPIQLTWIGVPCTSAIANIDYTLVDPVSDPAPYSQRFYTEKLIYLKKTFLCYPFLYKYGSHPVAAVEPPFKKNGYITFASFCNALKLTDKILKAWATILKIVPCSRLSVRGVVGTIDEISVNGLKTKFIKNGIELSSVNFLKPVNFNEYLADYNNVDIVLDTFPFNGATTTCDAFLMGVPVISMYGIRHHERVGLSMLKNVGLEDLAAQTVEEYVEKAVKLANDGVWLSTLKIALKETFINSPLTDTLSFKTEFENEMRKLYMNYCAPNTKNCIG